MQIDPRFFAQAKTLNVDARLFNEVYGSTVYFEPPLVMPYIEVGHYANFVRVVTETPWLLKTYSDEHINIFYKAHSLALL
jgi:hypothetical protein